MSFKKGERKRESVSLGSEMGEYINELIENKKTKEIGKKANQKSLNLLVCWQNTAPERILNHTDNVVYSTRSKDTELLVYVDSAAYAAELSMDKEIYRLKMTELLEKEITDIKFLVSKRRK